ncbi:MAG TPA: SprB repeat-containing protein, partial [Chitinophagaceae bacterium]|nr:SprB repeat-containing protein [Chitinophagaceae bacterium]
MRTFTQFQAPYSYALKRLPVILSFLLVSLAGFILPAETKAQACAPGSFVVSNFETGFFTRDNQQWTYLLFFLKNNNQNGISHLTFPLPTSGGCFPGSTYLGADEAQWARASYSTTKPTNPITNSLTMVWGKDNSCDASGTQDVLKISAGEIDKENGMWVRMELKGVWTFDANATIFFKYGNNCCIGSLNNSGAGSGFFGCYFDCALGVTADFNNIACYGGTTSVTAVVTGAAASPTVQYKLDNGPAQTSPIFTAVTPGEHTINVKQGPCEANVTFTVTQPNAAVDLTLTPTAVLCYGAQTGSIKAVGSGGTSPYEYKLEGGVYSSVDEFTGLGAGTYTVYVKDKNGC